MKDHVLVFVPGILGSELFYDGPGPFGNSVHEAIWAGDVSALFDTLASRPELLHISTTLNTGKVLRRLRLSWIKSIDVYQPLLDFLGGQLGYEEGVNFLPFAYDWRQSNSLSAAALAVKLRSAFPGTLPIKFVAHSMGGVLVRLLLSRQENCDLKARTTGFVQIGVPVRGASKAFRTLKHSPSFGGLFDHLLSFKQHLDPVLHTRLLSALNSFPSLLELLPPDTERIAVTDTDDSYSALYKRFWPSLHDGALTSVRRVHRQLSLMPVPCSLAIYSGDIVTERDYLIDENFAFKNVVQRFVNGDGTVSIGSAILGTELDKRVLVVGGITHDRLPNDGKKVWQILKRELQA